MSRAQFLLKAADGTADSTKAGKGLSMPTFLGMPRDLLE